jgi:RNA polymerase sigma-70 factor (ECF subfamily)
LKDPQSFERIYRDFFPGLLSYAKWLIKDESDAHEIVQDVFLKIWEGSQVSESDPRLKSYLYKAIKNKALNFLRDRKQFLRNDHESNVIDYQMNAQERLEFNTLKAQIDFAIGHLPDRCKLVFLLKRREGLSHKAIAELMEISEKTIENQMTKAMKMIKEFLEKNNA